ncbi:MAG: hypothetical protein SH808_06905 [Saprospiraceae bacterium]|nr:hypothetical protein [Saprospiraceae bacterium]
MIDLQTLRSLLDDEELVRKYLQRFSVDMPALVDQMHHACDDQQWGQLSIHAHTLKCQMLYINEPIATGLAYELEMMGASSSPQVYQIDNLLKCLEDQLKCILEDVHTITG